mgnify:CR=1 FL=1
MTDKLTIDDILKAREKLDNAVVPKQNRSIYVFGETTYQLWDETGYYCKTTKAKDD